MLAPLAEVAPEVMHPVSKKTMCELLLSLPDQGQVVKQFTPKLN